MSKMRFNIDKKWSGYHGEVIYFCGKIDIEHDVINAIDEDWRKIFYPSLTTPQKIAEHITFNIIINHTTLSHLDGFANFPDDYAKLVK